MFGEMWALPLKWPLLAAGVPVAEGILRGLGARVWRASGRAERNRRELYGGATGLRMLTFHEPSPPQLAALKNTVRWVKEHCVLAAPSDVDGLVEGRFTSTRDRVLFTCDDGMATNYEAAAFLEAEGIRATFFVVPSLLDRTIGEFLAFHARSGVHALPPVRDLHARGLSTSQVREMSAMGHRIAAHNFAHRDLGMLFEPSDLRYEIDRAVDAVSNLTGAPCGDFAIGFGQPSNVSDEAARHLLSLGLRVYACHRGLNAPGVSPRFLLRHALEWQHPFVFTCAAIEGGADHLLFHRSQEMVRRIGTLPPPPEEPMLARV